jgi:hypothetical protein
LSPRYAASLYVKVLEFPLVRLRLAYCLTHIYKELTYGFLCQGDASRFA